MFKALKLLITPQNAFVAAYIGGLSIGTYKIIEMHIDMHNSNKKGLELLEVIRNNRTIKTEEDCKSYAWTGSNRLPDIPISMYLAYPNHTYEDYVYMVLDGTGLNNLKDDPVNPKQYKGTVSMSEEGVSKLKRDCENWVKRNEANKKMESCLRKVEGRQN